MAAGGTYLQWAAANQPDIIEPIFYTTVPNKGDQWQKPGQQFVNGGAQQAFDPATYTGPLAAPPLTEQQRDAVLKYRRDKYKADLEAKRAAHPAPTRTPSGTRGGGEMEGGAVGAPPGRGYAPAPPPPPRPPTAPP